MNKGSLFKQIYALCLFRPVVCNLSSKSNYPVAFVSVFLYHFNVEHLIYGYFNEPFYLILLFSCTHCTKPSTCTSFVRHETCIHEKITRTCASNTAVIRDSIAARNTCSCATNASTKLERRASRCSFPGAG